MLAILGPSGSGKSTLLRCMNLLTEPDSGRVSLDGVWVNRPGVSPDWVRRQVGMVFQSFNLFTHLTALENISLGPRLALRLPRLEADRRARELLARVGLEEKAGAYPAQLSGGQQQRVAIARALAMGPKAVLFDEPTSALDPEYIQEVLDAITALAKEGMTLVVVTHEMGFARNVATRVAFMDGGAILELAAPQEFFTAPKHERARAFVGRILH